MQFLAMTIYIMDKLEQYILDNTKPEDDLMHRLERETYLRVINPRMISGHLQGKLLQASRDAQRRVASKCANLQDSLGAHHTHEHLEELALQVA